MFKQINGNASFSYKGTFQNKEPDGYGIMKIKFYEEIPELDCQNMQKEKDFVVFEP